MAFASTGVIGYVTSGYSVRGGGSGKIPNIAPVPAGRLVIVAVAKDNFGTTDGPTDEVTVSDNVNNSYTKLYEVTNSNAAVGGGVTTSIWYTVTSTIIPTGTLSGINIINNLIPNGDTYSTMVAWAYGFSINSGQNSIKIDSTGAAVADAAAFGSLSLSGLDNKEHLFIRCTGAEGVPSPTLTASHTLLYKSSDGVALTIWGEYRILTGTGDTSVPTTTGTVDNASVIVSFSERLANTPMFFASNF